MRRRGLILALPAVLFATGVRAHPWQDGVAGLSGEEVDAVLVALTGLAADRAVAGWLPEGAQATSLASAVFVFAAETDRLSTLPATTERVLMTYRALSDGIVLADGRFGDTEDVFAWLDLLHPEDVPAVSARQSELDGLRAEFGVERP